MKILKGLRGRVCWDDLEDIEELLILDISPSTPQGRCWVSGIIQGHKFSALLFPLHAVSPCYELGRSFISKLEIRCQDNYEIIANFDRGWEIHPASKIAQGIVKTLMSDLANTVYGKVSE
jgi:hypothetical protein